MALLISWVLSCLTSQNPLDFRRFPAKKGFILMAGGKRLNSAACSISKHFDKEQCIELGQSWVFTLSRAFCFDLHRVSRFSSLTASTATFSLPSFPKASQGYISRRKSIPNSTWQFTRVWREPAQLLLELCWVLAQNIRTALEVAQFAAWKTSHEKDAHNLNDTEYSIMVMTSILGALWCCFWGNCVCPWPLLTRYFVYA